MLAPKRHRVALLLVGEPDGAAELRRHLVVAGRVREVEEVYLAPDAARRGSDPLGVREALAGTAADAAIVVATSRWGARRLLPAPVVDGVPVGIVQEGHGPVCEVDPPDPSAPWVVAAMAKNDFLEPTAHWARSLRFGGRDAVDLRADRARRSDLVEALASGPGVVLYAGHGRTIGWSGYQGLRRRHLEPGRAAGLVVAFACDTLKRARSRVPFGSQVVGAGLARAYLGAVGSVRTADVSDLAEVVVFLLAHERPRTVAELMLEVEHTVADLPAARRAWAQFRLVGDPTTPLGAA